MTGSTVDPAVVRPSRDSSPPAKSTTNRQEKYLRGCPTTPPMPVRVATTRASGEAAAGSAPHVSR